MKTLAVIALGLGLAACGEKMTPELCVKTMNRMAQRTDECIAPGGPSAAAREDGAASFDDEVMLEMCKDEQMQRMATSSLLCLERPSCAELLACLKRPDLDDAVRKLVRPR